jgi:hypothetical protein
MRSGWLPSRPILRPVLAVRRRRRRFHHVIFHAGRDELVRRISTDTIETSARQWRLDQHGAYQAARSWHSQEAQVIDTTDLQPAQGAKLIAADAERGTARC